MLPNFCPGVNPVRGIKDLSGIWRFCGVIPGGVATWRNGTGAVPYIFSRVTGKPSPVTLFNS